MGGCCSKSTATTTIPPPPSDHQSDLKSAPPPPPPPPQHDKKKEIFVIKHRISHDDGTNATFTTTSSFKEEEFDDDNLNLVLQCGSGGSGGSRLSRSNSTTRLHNPNRKRSCRSNSSVDFDINTRFDNLYYHDDDDDDHRVSRGGGVSHTSSRASSKERRISISPSRTTGRRRRSESPFRSLNTTTAAGSSNPVKMVSVPATNKSSNFQEEVLVKRIHVKRNVSPAKTRAADLRVYTDQHETSASASANAGTKEADRLYYTRKSLVEIDNNAAKSTQIGKRTRKLSRDMNVETQFDPSPGPPSYASLLLEDIHKFHQNNPNATIAGTAVSPAFVLPECVTKARSIMEAVADLNSKTSSLCSEDRYRNLTMIEHQIKEDKPIESGTVVNGVSASGVGDQQPSQAEPTSHDVKVRGLGGFRKDFMDYPRKGTGHGRRSAYSFPKTTTVALT